MTRRWQGAWLSFPCLLLPVLAIAALTESEQRARIDFEVNRFEESIGNSGALYGNAELDRYLHSTLDRLFPDQAGRLHVRTISDSEFNAFALPSGGIYFNTGALLRIEDEAQLATVLGHEGTHITGDHTYLSVVHGKHVANTMTVGIFLIPLVAQIAAISSMAGFSREHERDADNGGFDRMVAAGFDAHAGAELFGRMDRELSLRKLGRGMYFYTDHPRVQERVASLTELAAKLPAGGDRNRDRYLAITEPARLAALAAIHKRGDGKLLVFLLEDEKLLATLPPATRYYLGEGYRLRAGPGGPGTCDRTVPARRAESAGLSAAVSGSRHATPARPTQARSACHVSEIPESGCRCPAGRFPEAICATTATGGRTVKPVTKFWLLSLSAGLLLPSTALAWNVAEANKPFTHQSSGYSVQFPPGWKYNKLWFSDESGATRDGPALQAVFVDFRAHKSAFKAIKKQSTATMLPQETAEHLVADMT